MLSFRKKLILSDFILLLVFVALLFPLVEKTAQKVIRNSLKQNTCDVIDEIRGSIDVPTMIAKLQETEFHHFFCTSLIDPKGRVLFESHIRNFIPYIEDQRPEVLSAFASGVGYQECYSPFFSQTFVYVAKTFDFAGQTYVLRTGFPYRQIEELTRAFEIGFLSFGALILLLYGIMTWAIVHRLSEPMQRIINEINSCQEQDPFLPKLDPYEYQDDFGKLAETISSLSDQVRRQIETITEERNENKEILDALLEGVISVDANYRITYFNPKAQEMLNLNHVEHYGQTFTSFKQSSELLTICSKLLMKSIREQKPISESFTNTQDQQHLQLIIVPKKQKLGAILVLQDLTTEYKVLDMGRDFIQNASHELRTPITIIQGFVETLQDMPNVSKDVLGQITEKMARTCNRLSNLVKNLLILAGLENQNDTPLSEVSLNSLLINCKHILLSVYPNVDIEICEKQEIKIQADGGLLELAIMNLLENSVKYSSAPAKIRVFLSQADDIILTIEDCGIGIPKEDIDHIFGRFFYFFKNFIYTFAV